MKKMRWVLIAVAMSCFCFVSNKYNLYRNYLSKHSLRTIKQPELTLVGRVKLNDGISRLGIDIAEALKGEVQISAFAPRKKLKGLSEYQRAIFKRNNKTFGKVVILTDALFYYKDHCELPNYYKIIYGESPSDQIRYVYSMIESSQIPETWVNMINGSYDAVIVPDPYLAGVYEASGVTKPIFVVPIPLTLSPYLTAPLKTERNKVFTFGCTSSCTSRKNIITLVKAFIAAFGSSSDVCLKINARYADEKEETEVLECIKKSKVTNIIYTNQSLSEEAYLEYMQSFDCFVTLSKGEGFSIQPRQAMALGIPTIVTDNTSQSTIAHNNLSLSVPSKIPHEAYYFFSKEPLGYEYECSLEDAQAALLKMVEEYPIYLERAAASREWAKQYDITQLKNRYKALVKPTKVVLSEKNSVDEEGLSIASEALLEKYQSLGLISH